MSDALYKKPSLWKNMIKACSHSPFFLYSEELWKRFSPAIWRRCCCGISGKDSIDYPVRENVWRLGLTRTADSQMFAYLNESFMQMYLSFTFDFTRKKRHIHAQLCSFRSLFCRNTGCLQEDGPTLKSLCLRNSVHRFEAHTACVPTVTHKGLKL